MNKPFVSLNARTYCHATENLEKVKSALESVVGKLDLDITRTEGHHGNPIVIIEASTEETELINRFFSRMSAAEIDELASTLSARVDEGCNLFVRIDKQAAYGGDFRLAENDDAILVRIRVRAFPARYEKAIDIVQKYLESLRLGGGRDHARGTPTSIMLPVICLMHILQG